MSIDAPSSDAELLDLLRINGPMGVSELAAEIAVTATAVRQRLMRLMAQRLIEREPIRNGRGRPRHMYRLTDRGLRMTGSNFTDLALALWHEISEIKDGGLREEMVRRIAAVLASQYADQIQGSTAVERMRSLGQLLAQRRIPVSVEGAADNAAITEHACPYPGLADQDRNVCRMEQILFSRLLGRDVELAHCRLDGAVGCRFEVK